ncbi:PucR C-terminal helix-turn-helix domain-containing protein [Brevibacterium siliguriense]|uniref:PucR C-terminal helix-turn-helix domain-containing protein n=1 Tax=Brevibacterium siliguriense TaxID=1136497 RepID=A0A1H1WCR9_9MICO|nr:PucR family transcriptional regulator [Brevibacterium siliguriense]SDS94824.1 PucR C-terminal helix-turn-helix domain-containing protein [Brevibacterium siliguriense]
MTINDEHSGSNSALADTHCELGVDIECLARAIVDDIVTGEHAYAEKHIPLQALIDIVAQNLRSLLASLSGGDLDLNPAHHAGRMKAEHGVELAGVLHAYRLAGLRLWRELAASNAETTSQDRLFFLGAKLWVAVDGLSTAAAETHREVTGARDRLAEQSRMSAVVDLLSPSLTLERRETAARLLELDANMRYYVIVTSEHDSDVEIIGARTHWAELNGNRVCLLALSSNSAEFYATLDGAKAGVSEEFNSLGDAAEAERQARVALNCLNGQAEGIHHYGQSPLDALIASQPAEAHHLAIRTLAEIIALPQSNRDMLVGTFEAWVECGGSLTATSAELHCHRNTVNYRLRKLETLTSRSLANPSDLTVLTMGVRTLRLLDHSNISRISVR